MSTTLPTKWQRLTDGLIDDPKRSAMLSVVLIAAAFAALRLAVAVTQWRAGYVPGGGMDLAMAGAMGFGGVQCTKIVRHMFGYTRLKSLDDHRFSQDFRAYWRSLWINLFVISACSALIYPLGIFIAFVAFHYMGVNHTRRLQEEFISGTRTVSPATVNRAYRTAVQGAGRFAWFGGAYLPPNEWVTHYKIQGSSNSGKTQMMRLYMRSVLGMIGSLASNDRAIIFDPKSEFYPFLRGLGIPGESIAILNPLDTRGAAWDLSADMTRPRDAATLAKILIPERTQGSGSGEFFDKAARRVFAALCRFFITKAPGNWTLRDLVLGAQSMELVGLLAAHDRKLKRDLQVMGAGDTAGNVVATVSAVIGDELETIAAYLDHHQREGRTFALKDWFGGSSILLLGADRESEATLQPYNQLLVMRFCELATSGHHAGVTHAIFDEVPALGKVGQKLDELARLGRSYGISLVIAFQAYSSLKELYGENVANALIGQCDKSAFLRVLDHDSAQWASKQIGETRLRRWLQGSSTGTSTSPGSMGNSISTGTSEQEQIVNEPAVPPEELMNLPKPDKDSQTGIRGFYKVAHYCYAHEIESQFISQMGVMDDPESPGLIEFEKGSSVEELRLWDESDLNRLGIARYLRGLDGKKLDGLPINDMTALCMEAAGLEMTAAAREATKAES